MIVRALIQFGVHLCPACRGHLPAILRLPSLSPPIPHSKPCRRSPTLRNSWAPPTPGSHVANKPWSLVPGGRVYGPSQKRGVLGEIDCYGRREREHLIHTYTFQLRTRARPTVPPREDLTFSKPNSSTLFWASVSLTFFSSARLPTGRVHESLIRRRSAAVQPELHGWWWRHAGLPYEHGGHDAPAATRDDAAAHGGPAGERREYDAGRDTSAAGERIAGDAELERSGATGPRDSSVRPANTATTAAATVAVPGAAATTPAATASPPTAATAATTTAAAATISTAPYPPAGAATDTTGPTAAGPQSKPTVPDLSAGPAFPDAHYAATRHCLVDSADADLPWRRGYGHDGRDADADEPTVHGH